MASSHRPAHGGLGPAGEIEADHDHGAGSFAARDVVDHRDQGGLGDRPEHPDGHPALVSMIRVDGIGAGRQLTGEGQQHLRRSGRRCSGR